MSEKVLTSLMHFFAFFLRVVPNIEEEIAKNIVIFFLQKQFDKYIVEKYTDVFIEYYNNTNDPSINQDANLYLKQSLSNGFLKELFISLPYKQRIFLLVNLLFFRKILSAMVKNSSEVIISAIDNIALIFKLKPETYSNLKLFISGDYYNITDHDNFLVVTGLNINQKSEIKKHFISNLRGQFFVLKFSFDFFLICYKGNENFYLDNKLVAQDNPYIISNHSSISSKNIPSIFFNDLLKTFLNSYEYPKIQFLANNIEYKFNKKVKGLHPFSFECKESEMVGIIGSSGVGKSTLLKLLCGIYPLHAGTITINQCNLQTERDNIKDIIGYIPQEEVLFENLTVFENILFHAKLCMKVESEKKLHQKIFELLENLGLYDIKDFKIGTISHKIISGGQRKRLNIAMELIRDPRILFIDEPTSGLSSSDAEKITTLLKQQVLKGKLIFVNLHQPSDQVLRLFDKLIVIDKGGYPVYFGHPGEAYLYLVRRSEVVSSSKFTKGFSESEKILEIIEDTTIDEFGNPTVKRKIEPRDWYKHLKDSQNSNNNGLDTEIKKQNTETKNSECQNQPYEKPTRLTQFLVYLIRNYKTRLANKSYIIISLFLSPILAFVLAFFCKQMILDNMGNFSYIFGKNENIPPFIFMSIIVALFTGLMSSAEEIIRNNSILKKEAFLNLSSISYLSSSMIYLILLSMIQTLVFTFISYLILQFKSGFFVFWLTLLSISFLANIIGLMISTIFNTTVAVYILIPFIIIPQILLSGTVVKFDNIHPALSSIKFTPFISDLMPTRWAYELIMVDQFKNNQYQKNIFDIEKQISNLNFKILAVIPELKDKIDDISFYSQDNTKFKGDFYLIEKELAKLNIYNNLLRLNNFKKYSNDLNDLLTKKSIELVRKRDSLFSQKDLIFQYLLKEFNGSENLAKFKDSNFNLYLAKNILQRESFDPFVIWENEIIRKSEPIYKDPESNIGRAHFYSSNKRIGNLKISTIYFNFFVICIYTGVLILLLFRFFNKKYKIR